LKKIVVIGPESTGKSTLSEQLAAYYKTTWVPEYAREYLEQLGRTYQQEDLLQIAKGQLVKEDKAIKQANQFLFCDTDLYVIKVWSEHKYGKCDRWILEQIAQRKYDLYLLTYIDVPWQEDPQREHPQPTMREYFYHIYQDIIINSGTSWADIRGNKTERLQKAINIINSL
jgi:NadR type nicotinamide-nucleotide adenylyltransferase